MVSPAVTPEALAAFMLNAMPQRPGQLPQPPAPAPVVPEVAVAAPTVPPPMPSPQQMAAAMPPPGAAPPGAMPVPGPAPMGAPVQPEVPVDPAGMPLPPGAMPMPPEQQAPPEPPTLVPVPLKNKLASLLNERKMQIAKGIAAAYGQPEGTVGVDDTELLKLWRYRNPDADPEMMRMQGMSETDIMKATYPLRMGLIKSNYSWKDKVKFAQKMKKLDATHDVAYVGEITYDPKKVPIKP